MAILIRSLRSKHLLIPVKHCVVILYMKTISVSVHLAQRTAIPALLAIQRSVPPRRSGRKCNQVLNYTYLGTYAREHADHVDQWPWCGCEDRNPMPWNRQLEGNIRDRKKSCRDRDTNRPRRPAEPHAPQSMAAWRSGPPIWCRCKDLVDSSHSDKQSCTVQRSCPVQYRRHTHLHFPQRYRR